MSYHTPNNCSHFNLNSNQEYRNLVFALSEQITPQVRSTILEKLMSMNNTLLYDESSDYRKNVRNEDFRKSFTHSFRDEPPDFRKSSVHSFRDEPPDFRKSSVHSF